MNLFKFGISKFPRSKHGFTLIEVLVVVAIIVVLSGLGVVAMQKAKTKALVAATMHEIKTMQNAFELYYFDTETIPPKCRRKNNYCTQAKDPFLNSLGVNNWGGPYVGAEIYNRVHRWGGHIGIDQYDTDGDGKKESYLVLDDDPPVGFPADTGLMPNDIILIIDQKMDDGNVSTGKFRTNVANVSTGLGSAVWTLLDP